MRLEVVPGWSQNRVTSTPADSKPRLICVPVGVVADGADEGGAATEPGDGHHGGRGHAAAFEGAFEDGDLLLGAGDAFKEQYSSSRQQKPRPTTSKSGVGGLLAVLMWVPWWWVVTVEYRGWRASPPGPLSNI